MYMRERVHYICTVHSFSHVHIFVQVYSTFHTFDHFTLSVYSDLYFCFIDYAKAFDCVDHNKLWKILKEIGIPDHLTCFLRNLYTGQEATVRTGHGTTDWFQIRKGVYQSCILSLCLCNLSERK